MNKKISYNEYDASKVYLWALLLPQVVSFVVALIFASIYKTPEEMASSLIYLFTATILSQACFAFIVFYYNKKHNINFLSASKLKTKFSYRNLIGCMAISVIAVFGFVNLINYLNSLLASLGFQTSGLSLPINSFWWFLINVLLLAVIPAVMEEFVFRGMIFNGLRKRSFWFATLISSAMFAFVHLSMGQFIFPILMGIIFSFILEKTGSILYTIICHLCNNFIVILISYINNSLNRDITGINVNSTPKALLVFGIAILAGILIFLIIKFVLKPAQKQDSQSAEQPASGQIQTSKEVAKAKEVLNIADRKNKTMLVYGSLIIGFVLWLIMIIYGFTG